MLLKFLKDRPLRSIALVFLLMFGASTLVPIEYEFVVIRAWAVALAFTVVISFAPEIASFIGKPGKLTIGEGLAFGIWLMWLGVMGHTVTNISAQFHEYPSDIIHSRIAAFFLWVSLGGGIIQLLASSGIGGEHSENLWAVLAKIVMVFVIVASLAVFLFPPEEWWDRQNPLNRMEPITKDFSDGNLTQKQACTDCSANQRSSEALWNSDAAREARRQSESPSSPWIFPRQYGQEGR